MSMKREREAGTARGACMFSFLSATNKSIVFFVQPKLRAGIASSSFSGYDTTLHSIRPPNRCILWLISGCTEMQAPLWLHRCKKATYKRLSVGRRMHMFGNALMHLRNEQISSCSFANGPAFLLKHNIPYCSTKPIDKCYTFFKEQKCGIVFKTYRFLDLRVHPSRA